MHTVVLGWFGASAVWFLPLLWRLVRSVLPGGAGLRGPGTIRLWVGFVCVLVASGALEATLIDIAGVDAFGHLIAGGLAKLVGHVAAPIAAAALFVVALPWLLDFRWRGLLAWADLSLGLGLGIGPGRRDAAPRDERRSRRAQAAETPLPSRTLSSTGAPPRRGERWTRPTVWRPPATTRRDTATGSGRTAAGATASGAAPADPAGPATWRAEPRFGASASLGADSGTSMAPRMPNPAGSIHARPPEPTAPMPPHARAAASVAPMQPPRPRAALPAEATSESARAEPVAPAGWLRNTPSGSRAPSQGGGLAGTDTRGQTAARRTPTGAGTGNAGADPWRADTVRGVPPASAGIVRPPLHASSSAVAAAAVVAQHGFASSSGSTGQPQPFGATPRGRGGPPPIAGSTAARAAAAAPAVRPAKPPRPFVWSPRRPASPADGPQAFAAPTAGGAAPAYSQPPSSKDDGAPHPPVPENIAATLRAIEENAARWTTLAGASLALRGALEHTAHAPVDHAAGAVETGPATQLPDSAAGDPVGAGRREAAGAVPSDVADDGAPASVRAAASQPEAPGSFEPAVAVTPPADALREGGDAATPAEPPAGDSGLAPWMLLDDDEGAARDEHYEHDGTPAWPFAADDEPAAPPAEAMPLGAPAVVVQSGDEVTSVEARPSSEAGVAPFAPTAGTVTHDEALRPDDAAAHASDATDPAYGEPPARSREELEAATPAIVATVARTDSPPTTATVAVSPPVTPVEAAVQTMAAAPSLASLVDSSATAAAAIPQADSPAAAAPTATASTAITTPPAAIEATPSSPADTVTGPAADTTQSSASDTANTAPSGTVAPARMPAAQPTPQAAAIGQRTTFARPETAVPGSTVAAASPVQPSESRAAAPISPATTHAAAADSVPPAPAATAAPLLLTLASMPVPPSPAPVAPSVPTQPEAAANPAPAASPVAQQSPVAAPPASSPAAPPAAPAPAADEAPSTTPSPAAPTQSADDAASRPPVRGHAPTSFEFRPPAASAVELPGIDLLERASTEVEPVSEEKLAQTGQLIEQRLQEFKVPVAVVGASAGPVITRFEIEPALGVRGSQIVGLMKDLSRGLGLTSIRVVETIPGKTCMGLELPNARRQMIRLSEILESGPYQRSASKLTIAMGKDIVGQPVVTDLAKAPHMLVAGTTGSGKSVAINAMILSLLFKATPEEVRLIMIDPKMLELSVYEGIPHLLAPVVTDMKLAANALNWCVGEMEKRYRLMSAVGVRNLAGFNQKIRDAQAHEKKIGNPFSLTPDDPEPLAALPMIVVVIDELADLMMVAGKKIEELIARLAQKARAAGIHLILATQRPSVDVITGLIKANIPTRVAFQVSSKIDSRTILDQMGAESLLGQGDMLFLPPGTGYPQRVHGAFVADEEVHSVVEYLKQFGEPEYIEGILDGPAIDGAPQDLFGDAPDAEADPLYDEAVAFVVRTRRASISSVQRQLRIGYNRAARLVEQMEAAGLVSPMGINGSREVLAPGPAE